jgi:putative peptidoglycan lipid II flippase
VTLPQDSPARTSAARPRTGRAAATVAIGILCSRLVGLLRQHYFSKYFGLKSEAADAFTQAFRIPNLLQNLFGEGALSASFVPVYVATLTRGEKSEATRIASAVGTILALAISIIVLLGVLAAPVFIAAIAPGFTGAKRELTISLVRILFPGAGILVFSAWCLGILNSHHRFLLSYTAPVLWNVAMIATLVIFRGQPLSQLAITLAWGSVIGSALQFVVQLPSVLSLVRGLRPTWDTSSANVRSVLKNFAPTVVSRGVVQISAWVDSMIASYLPTGAPTGLVNAQLLYTLPVSLFGMSISTAELTTMSAEVETTGEGDGRVAAVLRTRLDAGLRQIAFLVIPSAMAFLALGDMVASVLQTGRFTHADALYVWGILAGSAVGLLAQTLGRLYASTYYVMRDTRTPLRFAIVRLVLTTVLGYICALVVPPIVHVDAGWGAAGLTASAGVAGWVEFLLLRRTLNRRIGHTGVPPALVLKLWAIAAFGAAVAYWLKLSLPPWHPLIVAALVLGTYGTLYLGIAVATGLTDIQTLATRLRRR